MTAIAIEHNPSEQWLPANHVYDWPVWRKEPSEFPCQYQEQETCYILEGKATATPEHGSPVMINAADLVTFPSGMRCHWHIHRGIHKHYRFTNSDR